MYKTTPALLRDLLNISRDEVFAAHPTVALHRCFRRQSLLKAVQVVLHETLTANRFLPQLAVYSRLAKRGFLMATAVVASFISTLTK